MGRFKKEPVRLRDPVHQDDVPVTGNAGRYTIQHLLQKQWKKVSERFETERNPRNSVKPVEGISPCSSFFI